MTKKRDTKMSRREVFAAGAAPLAFASVTSSQILGSMEAEESSNDSGATGDQLASSEDYANVEFDALEVDLDKARTTYGRMWSDLAIALVMMRKTPDECRAMVENLEEAADEETQEMFYEQMCKSLPDAANWFKQAAELIDAGSLRFLVGMCRYDRQQGGTA